MRKLKLLFVAAALALFGVISADAQASYNTSWTEGVEVTEGSDFFLYNIGAGRFLDNGMNWGSRATVDNSGKALTLTASNGAYTIFSEVKARYSCGGPDGYLGVNGYMDGALAEWTFNPVTLNGYTNVYTISNGDNYLVYQTSKPSDDNPAVNVTALSGTNNDYWLLITREQRQSVGDYTYLLDNTCFNRPWENKAWTLKISSTGNSGNGSPNQSGGNADNRCAESYRNAFTYLENAYGEVVNGKYRLYNQGFYRLDGGSGAAQIYANGDVEDMKVFNANNEGTAANMAGASTAFSSGQYVNSVETVVNDGKLSVGIKNDNNMNWVIWTNFYLEYLGTCLINDAVALPESGAMEADTWYFIEIGFAADDYNATAASLGNIICTDDGTQLTASATGNFSLTAQGNSLEAKRYYFKSSSANSLVIAPSSYSYTVGTASADMVYIQPGNTVTVSYGELSTNDPNATLIKDFSGVTLNGEAIDLNTTDKGFTFTVPTTITSGTPYTLAIPAGAIGYDGNEVNADQEISLTSTAVFDGIYYMYNTDTETYISRAGNYNTQAVLDNYGLAFIVSTDANNNTQLQYFDSHLWLGDDGFCYGDCNDTRRRFYNVTKVDGGYKFLNTNNNSYLAVYDGQTVGDAVEGGNLQGTSNVWALESTADHVAVYTTNANVQAAAAASAAGLTGIETKAALDAELASNYGATNITITGSKAEKYQIYPTNGREDGPITYYSEKVNNLKPGLYKLSVDAFQRAATNESVFAADGARGLIYLYAGDAKTQLKSVSEYGASSAYANTDYINNGLYYPNRENTGYDALATGNFSNEVYVYVADAGEGTGSLEIGIKNPSRPGANVGTWSVYNNWTLTFYEAKATDAELAALAQAIEDAEGNVLGFDVDEYAPYNNVDAVIALAAAKAIDPETASSEAVLTATDALISATWTENTEELNAIYDGTFANAVNNGAPLGWTMSNNSLGGEYHSRAFVGDERLAEFNDTYSGFFMRFDGTNSNRGSMYYYGNTEGYTMPLAEGATYRLTVDFSGWGSTGKPLRLNITGPEGFESISQQFNTENRADTEEMTPQKFDIVFVATVAGDYVISFQTPGSDDNKHNVVISNASLMKAQPVSITMTDAGYATYCSDVALDFVDTGLQPYVATMDGENVVFEPIESGKVPAGVGILIGGLSEDGKAPAGTYEVRVSADADAVESILVGVTEETVVDDPIYVLLNKGGKVGFFLTTSAFTVKANSAYLPGDVLSGNGARQFIGINGEGTTTGIAEIENGGLKTEGSVYNLNGQLINQPTKGLYIMHGKKVVIK